MQAAAKAREGRESGVPNKKACDREVAGFNIFGRRKSRWANLTPPALRAQGSTRDTALEYFVQPVHGLVEDGGELGAPDAARVQAEVHHHCLA